MRKNLKRAAVAAAIAPLAAAAWYWRETTCWFHASQVDRPAAFAQYVSPVFPRGPGGAEYFGRLRLDLYIDETGHVDHIEIAETTLPPAFADAAIAAFAPASFDPARRHGRAVRSVKTLELDIEPPGADTPAGR